MTELDLERAIDNLQATYLAVGGQGEGAWLERWPGGVACLSRLHHPVSNFAVIRSLSRKQAESLRGILKDRRQFNAYLMPCLDQETSRTALASVGFRVAGQLQVMVSSSDAPQPEFEPVLSDNFERRMDVARFMAQQFFASHSANLRESIALATARSEVELFADRDGPLKCAAMVSQGTGSSGIYNLCVAHSERDKGYGSAMLLALRSRAGRAGKTATLQCEPKLEPWYLDRGFRTVGSISIMTLDRKASQAIM
jgi:hypothetical protein